MKVSLLGLVALIFVVACSSPPPTNEVPPTAPIEATLEATTDIQATIDASVQATRVAESESNLPTPMLATAMATQIPTHTLGQTPAPTKIGTPTPDYNLGLANLKEGIRFHDLGLYEEALQEYKIGIARDPSNGNLYWNRAQTLIKLSQGDEVLYAENKRLSLDLLDSSIKDYDQAIVLGVNDIRLDKLYSKRGFLHYITYDYSKSVEDYTMALELEPSNPKRYWGRGRSFQKMGEYTQAIDDFSKAISLEPSYAHAFNSRGDSYNSLGQTDLATGDWRKACDLDQKYCIARSLN